MGHNRPQRTLQKQRLAIYFLEGVAGVCFLLGIVWTLDARFGSDQKAQSILKKMVAKYASSQTFEDRIELTVNDREPGATPRTRMYLANVVFQKPASLRFEFSKVEHGKLTLISLMCAHSKKGIHSSGGLDSPVISEEGWSADSYGYFKNEPSGAVDMAFESVVSGNLPTTEFINSGIIGLLVPDGFWGLKYSDYGDVRLKGTAVVDSRECYVLKSNQYQETLWIDKETYALRKVAELPDSSETSFWKVQLFHPKFDQRVDEKAFHLDPSQLAVAKRKP